MSIEQLPSVLKSRQRERLLRLSIWRTELFDGVILVRQKNAIDKSDSVPGAQVTTKF